MSRLTPLTFVALTLALLGPTNEARACSCLPSPGIEHVYAGVEHLVRVNVRREVRRIHRHRSVAKLGRPNRIYRAKVKQSYKGCMRRGRILRLETALDSGLCGMTLDPRTEYVLALDAGDGNTFRIHSCGFIRETRSLDPAEREFLDTRLQCCDGRCECTGSEAVACLVDPCSVESCGDAACEPNYCGGCKAEFSSPNGQPVCTGCTGDLECGFGQTCESGLCIPEAACGDDGDCPSGTWCRPTEANGSACVPFAREGEACEGLMPPWEVDLCSPEFDCKTAGGTPISPDFPGSCAPPRE